MVNKVLVLFLLVLVGIGYASWNGLQEKQQIQYVATTTDGVIIYPTFTDLAYSPNGFYQFLLKKCDTCNSVSLDAKNENNPYASGYQGATVMSKQFPIVTDIQVDQNPAIIKPYKKVILMHNEFVTQKEYDAIMNHTAVVYLYPNALHNKISVDYNSKTAKIIQANGYPNSTIGNAFGWKYDNSNQQNQCKSGEWSFYAVPHGQMLNCYPEGIITKESSIIDTIKGFN